MYNNFSEYWTFKKDIFIANGVSRGMAHDIWLDACNLVVINFEKKLNRKN